MMDPEETLDTFQHISKSVNPQPTLTLNGMSLKVTIKHEAGRFYPPQMFINRKYIPSGLVYT